VSVQKVSLCPFHFKPRPSGVSLESRGLENILQVPGDRAEVDQNHDARNGLSVTLSVLGLSRFIFWPRSSKVNFQNVLLSSFHWKSKPSGVSLESPGLENIPPVPGNQDQPGKNHDARKAVSASLWVLK